MSEQANRSVIPGFDRWSSDFDDDRLSCFFRKIQTIVIDQMNLGPSDKLLDIGCATGWALEYATQKRGVGFALGIDLSGGMVQEAHQRRFSGSIEAERGQDAGLERQAKDAQPPVLPLVLQPTRSRSVP